jgi:4-amino-4-deoxy-L-arabinose transferase-like glycosyltransferase
MYVTGDYISTRLCDCLWFEKPALVYWMSAASYHLLGVNELAARLPSALMALATVILLFITLRRIVSRKAAIASAVVLATSGIFLGYARVATPDMLLAATMSFALISGYIALSKTGRAQAGYWLLSFASIGLSMLAKGLAGVLLTVWQYSFSSLKNGPPSD